LWLDYYAKKRRLIDRARADLTSKNPAHFTVVRRLPKK